MAIPSFQERTVRLPLPVDLRLTLGALRHGSGDPTMRFEGGDVWRATRTPEGPGTERLSQVDDHTVRVIAWGPGAAWLLDRAPDLLGSLDDPGPFLPRHPILLELHRRMPGLRFGRTLAVLEALVPAITEQKVVGSEARYAYRWLVRRFGEPAPAAVAPLTPARRSGSEPGPEGAGDVDAGIRLVVPPDAATLAALPSYDLHELGLERRRAETIRRAAKHAGRLEEAAAMEPDAARERLMAIPGIGRWTAAEVARAAFGDPDAVSVGDYHVPSLVCWTLAGEPRGDDARMLELLEPYRGQRARAVRLLELGGAWAPRHGPPLAPRRIQRI